MTKSELERHIRKYITIQLNGEVYSYDKEFKMFTSNKGQKMSLEVALARCFEIKEGWAYTQTDKEFIAVMV